MNELFRFNVLRPPASSTTQAIDAAVPGSVLQRQLSAVSSTGAQRYRDLRAAAQAFLQQPGNTTLIQDSAPLASAANLDALAAAVSDGKTAVNLATLRAAIAKIFGSTPENVVASQGFTTDRSRVFDSLILAVLVPSVQRQVPEGLARWAHAITLVIRAATNDATLDVPGAILAALSTPMVFPAPLLPPQPERIKPVGVADLMVVRQSLKRYELGEISDINNILKGEKKDHTLRHTLTTTQSFSSETEVTKEDTKDLQTTDRFELSRESDTVQKEDESLKAGVSISASYGSTLQVKANTDFSYSTSKSDSEKQASDYSRNVVSRAVKKVTERTLTQQSSSVTEVYDDTSDHGFDNVTGAGNVVGVYQWVNKIYESQVFNYGTRLMFDVNVPEPAAFVLDAVTFQPDVTVPVKPDEFALKPNELSDVPGNPNYYGTFVAKYQAGKVEPPPPLRTTVSAHKSDTTDKTDANDQFVGDTELKVPDGYRGIDGWVTSMWNYKNNDPAKGLRVTVGNVTVSVLDQTGATKPFSFPSVQLDDATVTGITDLVPIGIESKDLKDYEVTVVVRCERLPQSFVAWQFATHGAIQQAYAARLGEYNTAMKDLQFNAATTGVINANTDTLRAMERAELKKGCIGFLAAQNVFDMHIDDIVEEPATIPPTGKFSRPDLLKTPADASLVRFFEQAFEWENITYVFYPYFWGRSDTWYQKALLTHSDAMFAEFLKAGSARVIVPVRRNFEEDVMFWVKFGVPWMGGSVPVIGSADYLPIDQEIRAIQSAPGDEVPVGDPWEVKLPTTLVKLRNDGNLPEWIKIVDPDDPNKVRKVWVPAKRDQNGILVPDPSPQ